MGATAHELLCFFKYPHDLVQIAKALLDHEQQRSCSLPIVNLTMRNEQVAKLLVVLHWRLCSPGTGHDPNIGAKPSIQQLAGSGSSSHPLPDQAQSSQCCMTTASPANSSCQVALIVSAQSEQSSEFCSSGSKPGRGKGLQAARTFDGLPHMVPARWLNMP